jgi:2-methylcitrate dehydratase PrpD
VSAAARYAEYVHGARFEALPPEVREMAKYLILDAVGCALGATQTREGQVNIKLAEALAGKREATVIGGGLKIGKDKSAFVNSQLINLLDFDDTHDIYAHGHLGCRIVPAALAVGEAAHASGAEVITAVALAYEIAMRVGRALGPVLWRTGLPALAGAIGPAVAVAKLLGLGVGGIGHTFGVLTLETGVDPRPPIRLKADVTPSTQLGNLKSNVGQEAELGLSAALKARGGLVGMPGLLEVDFTSWYLLGLPAEGYERLTEGLSSEHRILDMSFKPTPSCRWAHAPITAAWRALDGRPVEPAGVARIEVRGVNRLGRYRWEDMIEAQFSTPCALAMAIAGETPGPAWYVSGRFRDPDIRGLAGKVELVRDPGAEALEIKSMRMTSIVQIEFRHGEVKSGRCEAVKGAPGNPMSESELVAKFEANASHLPGGRRREIMESILGLEGLPDVAALMRPLGERV